MDVVLVVQGVRGETDDAVFPETSESATTGGVGSDRSSLENQLSDGMNHARQQSHEHLPHGPGGGRWKGRPRHASRLPTAADGAVVGDPMSEIT
jgi:hypothetical protein